MALQDAGRNEEAAAAFRQALDKRSYAPAAIRLGESLASADNLEAAAAALRAAVQLQGAEAAATYALGRVLLDLGHHGEAVATLEQVAVALARFRRGALRAGNGASRGGKRGRGRTAPTNARRGPQ